MKICYVAVDVVIPHYRGASTHVYEVAKNLVKLGNEVHVISRRLDREQPKHERLDGIYVHRIFRGIISSLPGSSYTSLSKENQRSSSVSKLYALYLSTLYTAYAGLATSRLINRYGGDVILERETSLGAGAIASTLTGKPMVLEIIGPNYSKFSFKRATKIIAYTRTMIKDKVSDDKLFLITAAADTDIFKPDMASRLLIRKKYGLEPFFVIGYVGTFFNWHGLEETVEASRKILQAAPDTRFLMVGPYFEDTARLAEKHGVSPSFIFTGPVDYSDVPKYINAADILIAPYNPNKSELRAKYGLGSPLKVFEYMACGKPVITTCVEPITKVIRDGETGLLIPPGDSEALANAILMLMRDAVMAERMGAEALREVENNYSWKSLVEKIEHLLEESRSE